MAGVVRARRKWGNGEGKMENNIVQLAITGYYFLTG